MPNMPEVNNAPRALVGPTGYGSFGIAWRNAPALQERGGYSGPFDTLQAAEERAVDLSLFYEGAVPSITRVENVNRLCRQCDAPMPEGCTVTCGGSKLPGKRGGRQRTAREARAQKGAELMPKLIKGADLNPAQRAEVLRAFPYRWTHENGQRQSAWANISTPTMPLQHDEQWLAEHAFEFNNDGARLSRRARFAVPACMAEEEKAPDA